MTIDMKELCKQLRGPYRSGGTLYDFAPQAADTIEALQDKLEFWKAASEHNADTAMKAEKELEALKRENEWQDIDYETLQKGFYLCLLDNHCGTIKQAVLEFNEDKSDDASWWLDGCELSFNWTVTHTQPLPNPPKENDK